MNGLLTHYGTKVVPREEVFRVPIPAQTPSYMPLAHESFLTRIERQLAMESVVIKEQELALAKEGQRLFGVMRLEFPDFQSRDYTCVMGIRNSYDKSFPSEICVGAQVLVCDNLSFCGDMEFSRKHTPNLMKDLSWFLTETMAQLPAKFAAQSRAFDTYRQREITDAQAHDLMIRMYDHGALNITDIPHVIKEYRTPSHLEFSSDGKTLWRLFNASTEALKGNIWLLPPRTKVIHEILDRECARLEKEKIIQVDWSENQPPQPVDMARN